MMELSLKEIQLESLKILKLVDKICREQNLTYCLFYGTLIGAIRHNGFIPWDDDIDIVMPRSDYDKLKDYFIQNKKALLPYVYFDPDTNDAYPYMLARVCDTRFRIETENEQDSDMGCFIDIYPMDIVSDNKIKRFFISFFSRFYTALFVVKSRKRILKKRIWFYSVLQYPLYFFALFYSKKKIYDNQMSLIEKSKALGSNLISCIVWSGAVFKYFYNKTDISDVIDWQFEDCLFKIPRCYDRILRKDYGDYMKLPPEQDRIGHHFYRVFKKEAE
ncbi:LicD family protein [Treponema sp. OMZ 787]|uniref:LicD family protein n=1 Tax=Treponema sp. OMZ 787 TaxID=2563669 RepID=UPI0020A5081C|nr:LicD family protein [Treponema sp. OMZ 787]UTC61602.1 LicD family protein [Treponema sp. OMZ 787]